MYQKLETNDREKEILLAEVDERRAMGL